MWGMEASRPVPRDVAWRSEVVRTRASLKWNSIYKKEHGVSLGLTSAAITQGHNWRTYKKQNLVWASSSHSHAARGRRMKEG